MLSVLTMSEVLFEKIRLEFDTPQFLHALFGNDPKNLGYLEEALCVKAGFSSRASLPP